MRQLMVASALFALALLTTAATGQPPGGGAPQPGTPEKKADKKVDPTDVAIAAALANDADIKMAKAKIQLAEAELAKARQAVTQKVFATQATIQQARLAVATAELELAATLNLLKVEKAPNPQDHPNYRIARDKLEVAKTKLAAAETELKLLTGSAPPVGGQSGAGPHAALDAIFADAALGSAKPGRDAEALVLAVKFYQTILDRSRTPVSGPIPDRIRSALDKPVKLGAKGEKVTFEKALEVFKKEAGFDVPVRGEYPKARPAVDGRGEPILNPRGEPLLNQVAEVISEGEELPVGAWFQLYEDKAVLPGSNSPDRYRFYVREYGLLIAHVALAPPDALTLTDFWKQKPAPAKEPKLEPAPK